jgi:hypothetical protein
MSVKSDARWIAQITGVDYLWWRVRDRWYRFQNRHDVDDI